VLYFYPKDDTPGCTTQACEFRDNIFAFNKLGAVILGISVDDDGVLAAHLRHDALDVVLTGPVLGCRRVDGEPDRSRAGERDDRHVRVLHEARADVLTTPAHLFDELQRLRDAGCDDVLLFPCSADADQPRRLAAALDAPARDG